MSVWTKGLYLVFPAMLVLVYWQIRPGDEVGTALAAVLGVPLAHGAIKYLHVS